jgi:hypothetical protein
MPPSIFHRSTRCLQQPARRALSRYPSVCRAGSFLTYVCCMKCETRRNDDAFRKPLPLLSRFAWKPLEAKSQRSAWPRAHPITEGFGQFAPDGQDIPCSGNNLSRIRPHKLVVPRETVTGRSAFSRNVKLTLSHSPYPVFLLLAFGIVGATAMSYEISWARLLGTILGSSTYAFTLMLSTFLA